MTKPKDIDFDAYFWTFVAWEDNGCGLWLGKQSDTGRLIFYDHDTVWSAQRWAYVHYISPAIPSLWRVKAACGTPTCVNPLHLIAGPQTRRLIRPYAIQDPSITHCPNNHEYSAENTYINTANCRVCRICSRIRNAIYRQNRRNYNGS